MFTRIIIFFALIVLFACSSIEPVQSNKFHGLSVIKKGDSTELNWNFANANYVEIDKFPQKFKNIDSIIVSPEESMVYNFKAINTKDTMMKSWRVIVEIPEVEKVIEELQFETSYSESDYFRGVMYDSKIVQLHKFRITSTKIDDKTDQIEFRALILDKFGNYITNLTDENLLSWEISQSCDDNATNVNISDYIEDPIDKGTSHLSFLLDVSASAENNTQVLEKINDFTKVTLDDDMLSLYAFDHEYQNLVMPSKKENFMLSSKKVRNRRGLNAIYKSLFKQLNDIKDQPNSSIILLNYASNNTATIYNISDVILEARKYGIPVNVVSIGNSHDSFSMKYLAYGCGGRYYNIQDSDLYLLDDIISEIYFSQKSAYTFKIPMKALASCNYDAAEITMKFNENSFSDDIYFVKTPEWLGNRNQVIANFAYQETELNPEFNSLIESLSRVMVDNPNLIVELIGHSSIEGSSDNNMELALDRAKSVKEKILSLGAKKDQIKMRAVGNETPLFPLPNSSWQQQYNRRVEVKYLLPEMLPYEIIADERWTESEAVESVNTWRDRGYQSYYQRYLVDGLPKYKIKLWGFETVDQAKQSVAVISDKYQTKARVE